MRDDYKKCKDCKHLTDECSSVGRLCDAPKEWRTSVAMWKPPSTKACKAWFEEKDGDSVDETGCH